MRRSLVQPRTNVTEIHPRWRSIGLTTSEVLANCEDLKVLGKGDFKILIKWRSALREEVCQHYLGVDRRTCFSSSLQLGLDVKTRPTQELTETIEVTGEVDEEQQIQEEVGYHFPILPHR